MSNVMIPVLSQWSTDPTVNNPICTAAINQFNPVIVDDDSGGAIIAWYDLRNNSQYDIYAQRIDWAGNIKWAIDGISVCSAVGDQKYPAITGDGTGGAIITWEDYRNGTGHIYAQRITSSGSRVWSESGIAVCVAEGYQTRPVIASDNFSGAVIAWTDGRTSDNNIYAQRIAADGNTEWEDDGVGVCTAEWEQYYPAIINVGILGSTIIVWTDDRNSPNSDVYAQKLSIAGISQWLENGIAVCSAYGRQEAGVLVSDDDGGAIVAWQDLRTNYNITVQKILSTGSLAWDADGVTICSAEEYQGIPVIVADNTGGAIIAWQDDRTLSRDIYAQRINGSGDILWSADGIPICTAAQFQLNTSIAPDGFGGAIIAWEDTRIGSFDIYAQRVNSLGDIQWSVNGEPVCTEMNEQLYPQMIYDETFGAIITWQDKRDFSGIVYHVYASKISGDGALPAGIQIITAVVEGKNVELSWQTATEVNNYGFEIQRSPSPTPSQREGASEAPLRGVWGAVGFVAGAGNSNTPKSYSFIDARLNDVVGQATAKGNVVYRLKQIDNDGKFEYSYEVIAQMPQIVPQMFALMQNYPNPFNPTTNISFQEIVMYF